MNILYVAARFPWPLDRGARVTAYELIRALRRAGHSITLLSCVDGREPPEARGELERWCARVETVHLSRARSWAQAWVGLASPLPSQVAFYRSASLRERAERLFGESPDAVFAHMFRVAPAVAGCSHPARVLFLPDSFSMNLARGEALQPWWRRPGVAWERRRVAAYEVASAREFREAGVVSPVDREELLGRGAANVRLVPHGVDARLFEVRPERSPEPRLMFLGNLSVPHNVDAAVFAAREVLPRVRRRRPTATLWLAGADPVRAVRALAAEAGVTVTGRVPALQPLWAAAHVMVAPLRFSAGIQNKVLEAMAAGVPVVTTPGVAAGLGEAAAWVRVAEDADGLAAEVEALLADPAAAATRAAGAREHARRNFSWDALAREVERVVRESRAGNAGESPAAPARPVDPGGRFRGT